MADATNAPTYTAYWLYRLDRAFSRLSGVKREQAKQQFLAALSAREASVRVRGVYSFAGLRADADLMIWVLGQDLDAIQRLSVSLRHTSLGEYLLPVETYFGLTTPPRYDPEHQPAFMFGVPPKKYVSVYPFVKTADWYLLSREQRGELMGEHGEVGRRYAVSRERILALRDEAQSGHGQGNGNGAQPTPRPSEAAVAVQEGGGVLASTVDAFGLGDYEFILANESDDPGELCRMMMALRATEVRRYTKLDTPIFLGRLREPAEALADL